MHRNYRIGLMLSGALAASLAVAGCNANDPQDNARANQNALDVAALDNAAIENSAWLEEPPVEAAQMTTGAAAPVRSAPAVASLPPAAPLGYADWDQGPGAYSYIDEADTLFDAIGDAPPDYGFAYDDVEPWAWESDGYQTFAEPIGDDYRYYYYRPGAVEPFLVRDPGYAYGYRNGRVVSVYDRYGRVMAREDARRQAQAAARYYARARAMRAAARERDRLGIAAAQWADRRQAVARDRALWNRTREREAAWRDYRGREEAVERRRRIEPVREVRQVAARRYDNWQRAGFRGDAPDFYRRTGRAAAAARAEYRSPQRQLELQRAAARSQARTEAIHDRDEARYRRLQADRSRDEVVARRAAEQRVREKQQAAERARVIQRRDQAQQQARTDQARRQSAERTRAEQVRQRAVQARQQAAQRQRVESKRASAERNRAAQVRQQAVQRQRSAAQQQSAQRQRVEARRAAVERAWTTQARQQAVRQRQEAQQVRQRAVQARQQSADRSRALEQRRAAQARQADARRASAGRAAETRQRAQVQARAQQQRQRAEVRTASMQARQQARAERREPRQPRREAGRD